MTDTPAMTLRPRRICRADWVCVGVLLVVTLGMFWQGFFDRVELIRQDAAYVFQCYYEFASAEVRAGRFPHWNPYGMCGLPFHNGLQGALLYPLRWPLFWMSYPLGMTLSMWTHFFLTGVVTFIFIRRTLRCGPVPALIGALSMTFGGFAMGHASHPSRFQAYPWFILSVLLLNEARERPSWVWAVAAAIPVGLTTLTGDGNVPAILAFGLALWAVAEASIVLVGRVRGSGARVKDVLWFPGAVALALALGGALGMAQIYPALYQTSLSIRAGADWTFITKLSAHPLRAIVLFVAPFYWGDHRLGYWGDDRFNDPCIYAGIIPLVFAAVAVVVAPRDRWVARLTGLCLISAALGAGKFLPFYWVLYKVVPVFDQIRGPCRFYVWVDFGVACLAAIGLHKTLVGLGPNLRRRAGITASIAGVTIVVIIAGCMMSLHALARDPAPAIRHLQEVEDILTYERKQRIKAVQRMPRAVMYEGDLVTRLGIAAAAASCALCILVTASRKRSALRAGAMLTPVLVFDLGMFSAGMVNYSSTADRMVLTRPPHVQFLQERLGLHRYLCLRPRSVGETSLHRGMLFGIRHAIAGGVGVSHSPRQDKFVRLLWGRNPRFCNLAGVRYIVASTPMGGRGIRPALRGPGVFVHENTRVLPRAFLARQIRVFDNPNQLADQIRKGTSDLSDVALLEEEPIEPLLIDSVYDTEVGEVLGLQGVPGRYEMWTSAQGPRQLVLTESYHPQWKCLIDDQPAGIHRTDWVFMSVRVPAGEHRITWWFEPTRFKHGLVVTVIALGIVLGTLVLAWVRGRRFKNSSTQPA